MGKLNEKKESSRAMTQKRAALRMIWRKETSSLIATRRLRIWRMTETRS